jgi:hypothetical protein
VTTQELSYATFQFACKIPAGVTFQISAEPGNGSPPNRVDWGSITGDGTWQIIQRDFATAVGAENFRTTLNAMNSRNFKFVVKARRISAPERGFNSTIFKSFRGTNTKFISPMPRAGNRPFLNYLNANNSISFVPTFTKLSDAPPGGQTLTIDDYDDRVLRNEQHRRDGFHSGGRGGWPVELFRGPGRAERRCV